MSIASGVCCTADRIVNDDESLRAAESSPDRGEGVCVGISLRVWILVGMEVSLCIFCPVLYFFCVCFCLSFDFFNVFLFLFLPYFFVLF